MIILIKDWDYIMYDTMINNNNNCIYFIAYVIVIQYIIVNLFVLVILREFEEFY